MHAGKIQTLAILAAILSYCGSGKNQKIDEKSLVRVAIVKLVNASKQPNYDYLSDSLTEATQNSMDKKFLYYHFPAEKTQDLFAAVEKYQGVPSDSSLRSEALQIDADLLIYGFYSTTPGKKGDTVEIVISVFRTDKGSNIANLRRSAVISSRIFTDIESIAASVVAQITEYRTEQIKENGQKEDAAKDDEKIQFTRDSINIPPFIPPAF